MMNAEPPPLQQYKNRRAGLIVFGVLTILGGCVCGLIVPLLLLAPAMAARTGAPVAPVSTRVMSVVLYGAMAMMFIWLGIGSVMARRWARTLLAIQSWTAFVIGVLAVGFISWLAPYMTKAMANAAPPNQPPLSDSARIGAFVAMICVIGFFMVVLPLIWALFYSGRDVKATSEALDPVPRWTDRCPAPVLAASIWLAIGAVSLVGMMAYAAAPFFGVLLTGNVARAAYLCLAAVWAYCALELYRLKKRGWWIIFAALILYPLSSWITFQRHDVTEMYSAMGYSKEYIAMIGSFANSRMVIWLTIGSTLPWLAYLLYIRKFFATPTAQERVSQ